MNDFRLNNPVPFNFETLKQKTSGYLEHIHQEAARIAQETQAEMMAYKERVEHDLLLQKEEICRERALLESQKRAWQIREEQLSSQEETINQQVYEKSFAQGYEKGLEEGRQKGFDVGQTDARESYQQKLKQDTDRFVNTYTSQYTPLLDKMIADLTDVRQTLLQYWEENILQIAAVIAYQAINHEMPKMKEVPLELLKEALDLATGCTSVKIRMNPNDIRELEPQIKALLEDVSGIMKSEVSADSRIRAGGCVVETVHGLIDQQIDTRLERIITELANI